MGWTSRLRVCSRARADRRDVDRLAVENEKRFYLERILNMMRESGVSINDLESYVESQTGGERPA